MIRSLVFAVAFVVPALAFAQPTVSSSWEWVLNTAGTPAVATSSGTWILGTNGAYFLDTSGGAVTGTSGSMAPGMKPGVPGTPGAKHPYFFAAYAAVWLVLFGYVLWLGNRLKTLERGR